MTELMAKERLQQKIGRLRVENEHLQAKILRLQIAMVRRFPDLRIVRKEDRELFREAVGPALAAAVNCSGGEV